MLFSARRRAHSECNCCWTHGIHLVSERRIGVTIRQHKLYPEDTPPKPKVCLSFPFLSPFFPLSFSFCLLFPFFLFFFFFFLFFSFFFFFFFVFFRFFSFFFVFFRFFSFFFVFFRFFFR